MSDKRKDSEWIITYTGRKFWPLSPLPEDVCIRDIAHALAMNCRWTGHVREFYSVAQHCVLVSQVVPMDVAMEGLLHDASEAYLSDIARPIKHTPDFTFYRRIEAKLEECIAEKFVLDYPMTNEIRQADTTMLWTEMRDLIKQCDATDTSVLPTYDFRIKPMQPKEAEAAFLKRFFDLGGRE